MCEDNDDDIDDGELYRDHDYRVSMMLLIVLP